MDGNGSNHQQRQNHAAATESHQRETDGAVAASPKINASETTDLIPFKAVNAATVTNPEAWSDLGTACFHAITLTMPTHQWED